MDDRDDIILELTGACIETTARRAYRTLSATLLEDKPAGPEAEAAFDLLAAFLQQTDFRALRSSHPDLAGGSRVRVRIFRGQDGRTGWERVA